jgi:hypothetical protein
MAGDVVGRDSAMGSWSLIEASRDVARGAG